MSLIGSPRSFFRSGIAAGLITPFPSAPSGYTLEATHTFNVIQPPGWLSYGGAPDYIGPDATAPHSPDSVCQQSWPAGMNGGVGSWDFSYTFPNFATVQRRGIYLQLAGWYSPNWVTNLAGGQKILFMNQGQTGGGNNYLWSNGNAGLDTGPMSLTMRFQGMPASSRNPLNGGWNADQQGANGNLASRAVVRAEWWRCCYQLVMNDVGLLNGIARMWQSINGGPFNLTQQFLDVVNFDDTRLDRYVRGLDCKSVYGGGTTTTHPLQSLRFDYLGLWSAP